MDHIWHWGGGEYYFDISEKDCLLRITTALEKMKSASDELDDSKTGAADVAALHCGMIAVFFRTVLGDAAHEICTDSAEDCSAAYVDFILFVRDEVEALAKIRGALEEKLEKIST